MVNKNELKKQFAKEWEKHYKIKTLEERGFKRQKCKKCGKNFWAQTERESCADPGCIGYQFIGNPPSNLKLTYIETWKKIKHYFTTHGHGYVEPYPTVARWRDDLYFTIASINDFQPYVVKGEMDPPSNPLIVPQPCIRFPDISNVGVTGRHYTNFVMIGQHAFNTEKTGIFYWKEEALEHDINYLKELGIKEEDLVFIEDVWAGGGNFGPSMEYFSRGLELGNCVFMQYEITKQGPRELKTKVIDMGAGLSRLAWITHGSATSYEIVFGKVIEEMKKDFGVGIEEDLFLEFSKLAGRLNLDEAEDIRKERKKIAEILKVDEHELFGKLEPLQSLYATCDHTLTILFTTTDGMLPSNSGGGYNLRLILRRVFGFEEKYGFEFDFGKVVEGHAENLKELFPYLKEGVESTIEVIEEEKRKYRESEKKAKGKIIQLIKKSGEKIGFEELAVMYKSHGIAPETISEYAKKEGISIEIPPDFYEKIQESTEVEIEEKGIDVSNFPKTEPLYYSELSEFEAEVLGIVEGYVVLNKSAFYPESGGQVGDKGLIDGKEVVEVIKRDGVILHKVKDGSFEKGKKVKCWVDLKRRKIISKNHTGAHLLNAAAREILGKHVWQGGSKKDVEKAHLDITHFRRITYEELKQIEKKVNEYIMKNLPIEVMVLPRNVAEEKFGFGLYQGGAVPGKELRVVKIGEIDAEACGGTHHMNKSTGELGVFKIIKRESVQDGLERIVYAVGESAIDYIQKREELIKKTAEVVKVPEEEIAKTMSRFFNEWKERGKKIEKLAEVIAKIEGEQIIKSTGVVEKMIDVPEEVLIKIASVGARSERGMCALYNKEGILVCAAGKNAEKKANEILKEMTDKYGGSGGGSEKIARGRITKS